MADRGFRNRAILLTLFLVLGFSIISVRLLDIQYFQHEEWRERAEADYSVKIPLPARRGVILDRHGEQLVHNLPVYDIVADRYRLEDLNVVVNGVAAARGRTRIAVPRGTEVDPLMQDEYYDHIAAVLSRFLPMDKSELRQRFHFGNRKRVVLHRGMTTDEIQPVRAALERARISGIAFEQGSRRFYPGGTLMSHVLGYVDYEGRGREGVEATMDTWLVGEPGYRKVMIDRRGREIATHRGVEKPPRHGGNVHLTLHSALQSMVEEQLALALAEYKPERASAVLLDPTTGDILALANMPDFDTNTRVGERRNFAVSDVYEPGSTFKVFGTAAALDARLIEPTTRIFCHNGRLVEGRLSVPDHSPYGYLTVEEVIVKSSNIGSFQIARKLGMNGYFESLGRFGFGSPTGVRLTSESGGVLRNTGNLIDFSRASFGYALSVTPIQLAAAYGAIANDGMLMKTRVVDRVTDANRRVLWSNPVEARSRVVSSRAAAQTTRAMIKAVEPGGTGTRAAIEGYQVAGKTGTARRYNPQLGQYESGAFVVSFAGFLPADQPRLVCVVVIDHPRPEGIRPFGGTIAAPVFASIASQAMRILDIAPDTAPDVLAGTTPATASTP